MRPITEITRYSGRANPDTIWPGRLIETRLTSGRVLELGAGPSSFRGELQSSFPKDANPDSQTLAAMRVLEVVEVHECAIRLDPASGVDMTL